MNKIEFLNNLGFTPISENLAKYLEVKCNKCNGTFKRPFDKFNKGVVNCPKCEEKEKIELLNKLGFIPISNNLSDNLEVKCNKCSGVFKRPIHKFKQGITSCPRCEEKEKIKFLNNLGFTPVSENLGDNLKVKCNKCNQTFKRPYSNFKNGTITCPKCEEEKKIKDLQQLNFTILSENLGHDLKIKCNKCNYVFKRQFNEFKNGNIKCPNCIDNQKLVFLSSLGFTPVSENLSDNLEVKCNDCGYIFTRPMHNFARGSVLCPKCHPYDSSFEKETVEFIGECEQHNTSILNDKEIDIYIPNYNLAIELNGDYWHSEQMGKDKTYHLDKTKQCYSKNIQLIHIFESSWIEKKEIWKSILNSKLGRTDKIFARKCILKEVSKNEETNFLNNNHLQGFTGSSICYGLYYNNELVCLMSFGKSRFSDKAEWELIRLCSKLNTTVIGGASKLFKHFAKNHPGTILSYSDNLYSNGGIYKQLNMQFSHYSQPGYYYMKGGIKYSRQQFMKHKLKDKLENFDPNLTESENMVNNGYIKIWDCGQSVWIYK